MGSTENRPRTDAFPLLDTRGWVVRCCKMRGKNAGGAGNTLVVSMPWNLGSGRGG